MAINIRKPDASNKNKARSKSAAKPTGRTRSGQAVDFTAPRSKASSAPAKAPKAKKTVEAPAEPMSASAMLWRLAIVVCTAAVVISLIVASVRGGSLLKGTERKENPTPTPPVTQTDPNVNISGSDITPPPPAQETPAPTPEASQGGITINGVQQ